MDQSLDFIEIKPKSQSKAKKLMIFLHGYGTNKNNLAALSFEFVQTLPDCHFISLNAPFKYELASIKRQKDVYQWFSATLPRQLTIQQVDQSSKILGQFIDDQLKRLNLSDENLILCGFSQGAMMSIYHATRRPKPINSVIAIAGRIVDEDDFQPTSKPPICLIHGTNDLVVPFSRHVQAQEILNKHHYPYQEFTINDYPHLIGKKTIEVANNFLLKNDQH